MYYNDNTFIFRDGEFLPVAETSADLYAQGLHYGNAVFEGIRAYPTQNGVRIFKAIDHYERLIYSAGRMRLKCPYTPEQLEQFSYELLEKNKLDDAYLRPLVYAKPYMKLASGGDAVVVLQAWSWGKLYGDKQTRLMTSSFQRPNPKSCFVDAKVTGHYVNSILAANEAADHGYDDALLLDMNENIAEASGANIFMQKDDKIYTPPTGNILPGITRQTVIELCGELGIECIEKHFKPEDLRQADGAFLTGTAAEVTAVACIDEYEFPSNWTETLGAQIQAAYSDLVYERKPQTV